MIAPEPTKAEPQKEPALVVQDIASTWNSSESFPYWAESTTTAESADSGVASVLHEESKVFNQVPSCEMHSELVKRKAGKLAADIAPLERHL